MIRNELIFPVLKIGITTEHFEKSNNFSLISLVLNKLIFRHSMPHLKAYFLNVFQ